MTKEEVAAALDEIGTLLELKGENAFRTGAYHNGARAVAQIEGDLKQLIAEGKLGEVRGIGEALCQKITTLVETGTLPYLEDLRKQIPTGLVAMLKLPGVGPKKVKTLYDQLGIDDFDKLREACEDGRVAKLKSFGEKTQANILQGIAFVGQVGQRVRIDEALPLAELMIGQVRKFPGVIRSAVCGSIRRRRESSKDIDLLVSTDGDPTPIMDAFVKLPQVVQVTGQGDTKASVVVAVGAGQDRVVLNSDLRVVTDEQFPFALHYFTGSKDHAVAMRSRAQQHGMRLNEYALKQGEKSIYCEDEAAIFKALGLEYIEPELREDTGEMAAAEKGTLPHLIEVDDIRGVFHNHTTASDGNATLEEMALAAKKLGFEYLGIADHSQSLTIANGLTPKRVREQHEQIDELNAKLKGIRLLKGIECDILADGRMDFDDEVLATFDYVVASVHQQMGMPEAKMTERVVKAVSHPLVTMLGHATGRLILKREAYKINLDAVIDAAAASGTMIEINAQPLRLELDWPYCKRAKALGIPIVINPDAHATDELALYRYGVDVARRGWLEKKDVFNTKSLAEVKKALKVK
jgi:DNA polymerase (family 10)